MAARIPTPQVTGVFCSLLMGWDAEDAEPVQG